MSLFKCSSSKGWLLSWRETHSISQVASLWVHHELVLGLLAVVHTAHLRLLVKSTNVGKGIHPFTARIRLSIHRTQKEAASNSVVRTCCEWEINGNLDGNLNGNLTSDLVTSCLFSSSWTFACLRTQPGFTSGDVTYTLKGLKETNTLWSKTCFVFEEREREATNNKQPPFVNEW